MARPRAIMPVAVVERHVNIGIYGEPGVGKSVLAGTGGPKTLILASRANEMAAPATQGSKANMWVCNDMDDLTEAYEWVRHEGVNDLGSTGWVWIDNATLLQDQSMDTHLVNLHAAKPHRSQFIPDKPDYQLIQNRLSFLIKGFTELPINFGWTAHVEKYEVINERTGEAEDRLMPMFQGGQGKLSQKLCGYMGVIGYLHMAKVEGKDARILRLSKQNSFYARTRYASLGKHMVNPTIPKMMQLISKDLPPATANGSTTPVRRSRPVPTGGK